MDWIVSPKKIYDVLILETQITLFGNSVFSQVNEVMRKGPNPEWVVSSKKGEIWTQIQTCTQGRMSCEHEDRDSETLSGNHHKL